MASLLAGRTARSGGRNGRPRGSRQPAFLLVDSTHYPTLRILAMSASARAADRNLLFGILALQMDFVSRDQLIAAMNAWVLDKARPLGQLLVAQTALGCNEH